MPYSSRSACTTSSTPRLVSPPKLMTCRTPSRVEKSMSIFIHPVRRLPKFLRPRRRPSDPARRSERRGLHQSWQVETIERQSSVGFVGRIDYGRLDFAPLDPWLQPGPSGTTLHLSVSIILFYVWVNLYGLMDVASVAAGQRPVQRSRGPAPVRADRHRRHRRGHRRRYGDQLDRRFRGRAGDGAVRPRLR